MQLKVGKTYAVTRSIDKYDFTEFLKVLKVVSDDLIIADRSYYYPVNNKYRDPGAYSIKTILDSSIVQLIDEYNNLTNSKFEVDKTYSLVHKETNEIKFMKVVKIVSDDLIIAKRSPTYPPYNSCAQGLTVNELEKYTIELVPEKPNKSSIKKFLDFFF